MTRETRKVIQKSRFKSSDPSVDFRVEQRHKAVVLGGNNDGQSRKGLLGKVIEASATRSLLDHSVWLDLDFPHVIGIFGSRGSGKSFDLGILTECVAVGGEDVSSGADFNGGVVIFDVQDQFWTLGHEPDKNLDEDAEQLKTLSDWGLRAAKAGSVVLWLPTGCAFPSLATREFILSPSQFNDEDWLALLKLGRYSPPGQALLNLVERFPESTPAELSTKCQASQLTNFQAATVDALRWRLEALEGAGLIGQQGTNIEKLLSPGSVSILLLRELSDDLRALVVGVTTRIIAEKMGKMHKAQRIGRRTGKAVTPAGLPQKSWLIIDEAHTVAPNEGTTAATQAIVDYVKRGRDAGLSFIFATQQPSAVNSKLMSQVDLTITHRLGFENDLNAAVGRMPTRSAGKYETTGGRTIANTELIRSLDTGEAVIADASSPRIIVVSFRPRVSAHGGNTPK